MLAIRLQVDVMHRLVLGCVRLIANLNAPQVLDPTDTLHARHNESQGVTVSGRNISPFMPHATITSSMARSSAIVRVMLEPSAPSAKNVPRLLFINATHLQDSGQQDTREFSTAQHTVGVLHGWQGDVAPLGPRIGTALDEVDAGYAGQTHQVVHREHTRTLDQAVHHETVLRWIDVPPTLVVTLKMQTGWCDDAKQNLAVGRSSRRLAVPASDRGSRDA